MCFLNGTIYRDVISTIKRQENKEVGQ
uniref:Uncharacterized protein n=1 Tax=Rhizophora mucronata TaxID=61149 RepID=A0A2P2QFZ1_RHIMU